MERVNKRIMGSILLASFSKVNCIGNNGCETFEQLVTFSLTKWLSSEKQKYQKLELQLKSYPLSGEIL